MPRYIFHDTNGDWPDEELEASNLLATLVQFTQLGGWTLINQGRTILCLHPVAAAIVITPVRGEGGE
jgi:hypothetical protein